MTPAETLAKIRDLAAEAFAAGSQREVSLLLVQIHTFAQLGALYAGHAEARAAFEALTPIERQAVQ